MVAWWQGIGTVVLAAILVTLLTKSFPYIAKTMTNVTIAQEIEKRLKPVYSRFSNVEKELSNVKNELADVKKELSDLKDLLTDFLLQRYREENR